MLYVCVSVLFFFGGEVLCYIYVYVCISLSATVLPVHTHTYVGVYFPVSPPSIHSPTPTSAPSHTPLNLRKPMHRTIDRTNRSYDSYIEGRKLISTIVNCLRTAVMDMVGFFFGGGERACCMVSSVFHVPTQLSVYEYTHGPKDGGRPHNPHTLAHICVCDCPVNASNCDTHTHKPAY